MNEIKETVTSIFRKVFKDDTILVREEMTAADVEKWNSLTHLEMIAEVEAKFGIKFKLKELVAMKNVGDMLVSISAKTGKN